MSHSAASKEAVYSDTVRPPARGFPSVALVGFHNNAVAQASARAWYRGRLPSSRSGYRILSRRRYEKDDAKKAASVLWHGGV